MLDSRYPAIHVPRFGDHFQSLHYRLRGRRVVFAAASFFSLGQLRHIPYTESRVLGGLGTASEGFHDRRIRMLSAILTGLTSMLSAQIGLRCHRCDMLRS